tara:strand:- start:287 stop:658 length:372 start_codon:yes stop_codon:yes gene_type:complete
MSSFQEILEIANNLVPRISPNEAKAKQDTGALIIDIREREEINTSGMVKGAYHIPRGLLEFQTTLVNPNGLKGFSPETTIILYCASGGRAALAGKSLKDMGFDKVFNLGGLKDWIDKGLPIEK